MLEGRVKGSLGGGSESDLYGGGCPNVASDGVGEGPLVVAMVELGSLKGFGVVSSTSRTTSAGPKDVAAKGDVTGGRDVSEGDLRLSVLGVGGVLMTSALTTPSTWRTVLLVGVIIIGASLRKSLE